MNIWDNLTKIRMTPHIEIVRPFILQVAGREFTSAERYGAPKLVPLWLEWVRDLKDIRQCCPPMRSPDQTLERWMSLPMVTSSWGTAITYQAVCQRMPGWRVESHPVGYGYLWCMVPPLTNAAPAQTPSTPAAPTAPTPQS